MICSARPYIDMYNYLTCRHHWHTYCQSVLFLTQFQRFKHKNNGRGDMIEHLSFLESLVISSKRFESSRDTTYEHPRLSDFSVAGCISSRRMLPASPHQKFAAEKPHTNRQICNKSASDSIIAPKEQPGH